MISQTLKKLLHLTLIFSMIALPHQGLCAGSGSGSGSSSFEKDTTHHTLRPTRAPAAGGGAPPARQRATLKSSSNLEDDETARLLPSGGGNPAGGGVYGADAQGAVPTIQTALPTPLTANTDVHNLEDLMNLTSRLMTRGAINENDPLEVELKDKVLALFREVRAIKQAEQDAEQQAGARSLRISSYGPQQKARARSIRGFFTRGHSMLGEANSSRTKLRSSLVVYHPDRYKQELRLFMHTLDRDFFLIDAGTLPLRNLRVVLAFVAAVFATLGTNQLVTYSTFDLLDIEKGGSLDKGLNSLYTIQFFPLHFEVWMQIADGVVRFFSKKDSFVKKKKIKRGVHQTGAVKDPDVYPHTHPKSLLHRCADGGAALLSVASAVLPVGALLFLSQKIHERPERMGREIPFAFFMGVSFAKFTWDIISPEVDRLFTKFLYKTQRTESETERILAHRVADSKALDEGNDGATRKRIKDEFELIRERVVGNETIGLVDEESDGGVKYNGVHHIGEREFPIVTTALVCKHADRERLSSRRVMPQQLGKTEIELRNRAKKEAAAAQELKQWKADVDIAGRTDSWWDSATRFASYVTVGAGSLFAFAGMKEAFYYIFTKGQANSSTALKCAEVFAGVLAPATLLLAAGIIKDSIASFAGIFSFKDDLWGLRKFAHGIHSTANAVMFSLPGIVVARLALELGPEASFFVVGGGLVAFFLMYKEIFNRYDQALITRIFTSWRLNSVNRVWHQRVYKNWWHELLRLRIEGGRGVRPLSREGKENLYHITQGTS